jgi:molecular chaperone Hsp33
LSAAFEDGASAVAVECRFVRGRNALLCLADFGPLFMDLHLHFGGLGLVPAPAVARELKALLAVLTLHAAARPRAETVAWTVHFAGEGINLFAVAENPTGRVTGQIFDRGVRELPGNVLHAETAAAAGGRRRSSVDFDGGVLEAAAACYAQSEQREARFFELAGDGFALLVAQPDCDMEWLAAVDADGIVAWSGQDPRAPMETRVYRFECGCTPERIAGAIGPAVRGGLDELFAGEKFVRVTCPRCGLVHEIGRAAFGDA